MAPRHNDRICPCKRILNPAVYVPCTSLRRFCGFSPFCFFVESVGYAVSITPEGFDSNPDSPQNLESHRG